MDIPKATRTDTLNRPQMCRRSSSAAHNALMRQIMEPWGSLSTTPPGCRAISYSSWRRFSTASSSPKSADEMTASTLCEASGLSRDFNPPLLERCDLRVAENIVCGKPVTVERQRCHPHVRHRSQTTNSSASSWTTATSECSSQAASGRSEPIAFKKETVKRRNTNSLLTASFKAAEPKHSQRKVQPKVALAKLGKEYGIQTLSIEDLPEDAFESDSEYEG
ncbi:hypothetical protein N0V90_005189 [Kalmusia sp. IMI 367209]|nr:hypothetical protein N0V90_005189 [Kalmusia sp. IMI 367209]